MPAFNVHENAASVDLPSVSALVRSWWEFNLAVISDTHHGGDWMANEGVEGMVIIPTGTTERRFS
jgi:hypothetical protein